MEFNPDFPDKLNQLDDSIDDLLLDLMGVADFTFDDKKQFEQAKSFLKKKMNKNLLKLVGLMKRYEVFDRDIDG